MLTAIKYNLAHLLNFNGRDARSTFWFYMLFIVVLYFAISMAISIPVTGAMMGDALKGARQGLSEAEMQARMATHVGGMMRTTMWVSAVLSLASVGLILAAFIRRLHDCGKPGWIAIVAAAAQVASLVLAIASIDDAIQMVAATQAGDIAAVQGMRIHFLLQSLLGWLPLLLLIVFGVWPSDRGDNRYGPPPAAAI